MNNLWQFIISIIKNRMVYGPILTIIIAYIVYKIIKSALNKIANAKKHSGYDLKRRKTVVELLTNFVKVFTWIIVLLIILNIFEIDTTSVIASLGVASAVLGLAFQDTLKDVIAGVNIILDNYFIVGDYIKYNDFLGEVVSFGFKTTKVKNWNNEILTISNRNISEIINLSKEKNAVIIDIPIAYEEDIDNVEKIINKILTKINKDVDVEDNSAVYLGVSGLKDSSVNFLIKFISKHDRQWQTNRNALKIIKTELDKNGIKIPYQQIEVHNGKNI